MYLFHFFSSQGIAHNIKREFSLFVCENQTADVKIILNDVTLMLHSLSVIDKHALTHTHTYSSWDHCLIGICDWKHSKNKLQCFGKRRARTFSCLPSADNSLGCALNLSIVRMQMSSCKAVVQIAGACDS